MGNGDKDWFSQNAPKGAAKDWFASNAPVKSVETPDPTKPDPTAAGLVKGSGSKVATPYQMTNWFGPQPNLTQEQENRIGAALPKVDPFIHNVRRNVAETGGAMVGGEAFAGASKGLPWLMRLLASSSGAGAGAGIGAVGTGATPTEALGEAAKTTAITAGGGIAAGGVGKVASKVLSKVDPLAKINKLLGVGPAEVVPGKTPASLDEFAANPARGATKAGIDESALSKMNPLERNAAVMKAKDAAGKQLDQVLEQATQAGKKVDLYPTVDKVFDAIPDPKFAKQTENAFIQLLKDNGVTGPLDQVTPTQARAIQRGVESLKGEGMAEISAQLRRGISEATRKAVPESAAADQHYWDLANAAKGTQKLVKKYATSVPENKLRKLIIKAAIGGGAAALGYEGAKHLSSPTP